MPARSRSNSFEIDIVQRRSSSKSKRFGVDASTNGIVHDAANITGQEAKSHRARQQKGEGLVARRRKATRNQKE